MSKNRDKKHETHVQELIESSADQHEQHLIEAPKGTSRIRFIMTFGFTVFLVLIFMITGPMMRTLGGSGGGNRDKVHVSWTIPGGETSTLTWEEFKNEKQSLKKLSVIQQALFLGDGDSSEDIYTARFLVLEQMAQRAGLHISDSEVAEFIVQMWGDGDTYKAWIASRRQTPVSFEAALRRGLSVRRYILSSNAISSEVVAQDVIDQWLEGAKEFNFEFVEVPTADFETAAREELIDDEALEDYFTALPPFEKSRFNTERSMAASLAWYDPSVEQEYTTLFERFPRPEDEDADQVAQNYYNGFSHIRFVRPEPATDEEQKAAEEQGIERFYSFEEVKEQAQREAPVYYAMVDWLTDLQTRAAAGEEVSLEAEAAAVGLSFTAVDPRTRTAWVEGEEAWAGRYLFSALSAAQESEFSPRVAVEEGGLVVSRVVQILPPELPPFAEIRDQVADKWVADRQPELAVAKLEALRDAFGERPEDGLFETTATSEEFRSAVEAAGYTVQERGWKRQNPMPGTDTPGEAEFYIRSKLALFAQAADAVMEAEADRSKKNVYLVRCMGERDGDPMTMTPAEAQNLTRQARATAGSESFHGTFGDDNWIRSTFNMTLVSDNDEEGHSEDDGHGH